MSAHRILFVDDDANILLGIERQLHNRFNLNTALDGDTALEDLTTNGPYAVIVSDMRMPGMDGIQLLQKAKDVSPDTVRIMLTGNGEVQTAIEAVNEGNIFRFLTKPCPAETLKQALEAGIRQYELITVERELLAKTLHGCVRMLTEILSIVAPRSFGHAEKLRNAVKIVTQKMGLKTCWELDVAAMVCQIGLVTVPPTVIDNARNGRPISSTEREMMSRVPEIGRRLLDNIPRLETVARIVQLQNKHFDGTGFPEIDIAGKDIPLGSRILKVLNDLLQIEDLGIGRGKAFLIMKKREGWYDPDVLKSVIESPLPEPGKPISDLSQLVSPGDLEPGMVLAKDFTSADGTILVGAGSRLSETVIAKIRNAAFYLGTNERLSIESELSQLGKP
jgi:response regulator RpfG family c-di-GMP phosphodiesterase